MKSVFDGHSPTDMNGLVLPIKDGAMRIVKPKPPKGGLKIDYAVADGNILMSFSEPIDYMVLTPDQAGKIVADLEVAVRYARTLHVVKED